jgi:hypothetical protein
VMLTLQERVNTDQLEALLLDIDTCVVKEERTKFIAYAKLVFKHQGTLVVHYAPSAHGKGRVYASGAMSIQGFSHLIRNRLAAGIYHDIDMENCHPIFLLDVCQKNGWAAPCLAHYVANREDVLQSIKVPRSEAKKILLTLMYGGKIPSSRQSPFLKKFSQEMARIANVAYERYAGEIPVSNEWNPKFSRLSILLQDIEHQALMVMAQFFTSQGYQVGVYIFDGLLLYRRHPSEPLDPQLLRQCEQYLTTRTGRKGVILAEKEISVTL